MPDWPDNTNTLIFLPDGAASSVLAETTPRAHHASVEINEILSDLFMIGLLYALSVYGFKSAAMV
jgi:hypothetical protein